MSKYVMGLPASPLFRTTGRIRVEGTNLEPEAAKVALRLFPDSIIDGQLAAIILNDLQRDPNAIRAMNNADGLMVIWTFAPNATPRVTPQGVEFDVQVAVVPA